VRGACKGGFRVEILACDPPSGLMKVARRIGGRGASGGCRIESSVQGQRHSTKAAEGSRLESNRSARNS
jgi:hypothetical protein